MKFPIAEMFDSIQGEGRWSGTPMFFIRFAGCNVGEYLEPDGIEGPLKVLRQNNPKLSICRTAIGQSFQCDTDYHRSQALTAGEIMELIPDHVQRICLTGGEPFLHPVEKLFQVFSKRKIYPHIETSGTKPILSRQFERRNAWITCSPKVGFLADNYSVIDEFKFVVGREDTSPEDVVDRIRRFMMTWPHSDKPVYIQPVNDVWAVDWDNVRFVQEVIRLEPSWSLSIQLHKIVGVR